MGPRSIDVLVDPPASVENSKVFDLIRGLTVGCENTVESFMSMGLVA
jgi:hypothetical protein